jgi:hypothetical protein
VGPVMAMQSRLWPGCALDSLILRMFYSENRFPLFRNMRYAQSLPQTHPILERCPLNAGCERRCFTLIVSDGSGALHVRPSRCVTVEDKVAGFGDLVAGKAGVVHRRVGGFAVVELSEPPAAGRGVFS